MEKNIILTVLPSFFLKIFDEISDNPNEYLKLNLYKNSIIGIMILVTLMYTSLGSGYSFLLFIHGVFCALQKQVDNKNYVLGMIILFFGIILNDKNQLKKLLTTFSGIKYLIYTFLFVFFEEKLFPEEVSKTKIISRMIFIIFGIIVYYFTLRNINDSEIRTMLISNMSASMIYYLVSVIMKLSNKHKNPLDDNVPYIEEMIKRIYRLFFN
jgi:hypothetical protein